MPDITRATPKVARIRAEQIASWGCDLREPLERFLNDRVGLSNDDMLDLIYSEVLLREEFGEPINRNDLVRRFPEYADALDRLLDLQTALDSWQSLETIEAPRRIEGGEPTRPATIGNYEIVGDLGRGGMGLIYKGQHQMLSDRVAAIKVLRFDGTGTSHDIARIRAEANAAARLNHENIVPVYEFGAYQANGVERPFVAFEFVAGGNLDRKIAGNPLPPREAAEWLLPLARAMAYAHHEGVVHRDLKPANVLVDDAGRPKITDFGLAKRLDADSGQTRTGDIVGTPSYMAPEQALGQTLQHGPAVDIYALGAILYEMLTGRPPFRADTILHTLEQVVASDPVAPTRLQPTVPRDLETICLKCLRKEATNRYASAADLADDVQRFLNGEPIHARPASRVERSVRWAKRHPATAGLLSVCLVAAVGLAAIWLSFTFQLKAERDFAQDQKSKADNASKAALRERDEARLQNERANGILRHAIFSVDSFAKNARGIAGNQAETATGSLLFQLACSYGRTSAGLLQDTALDQKDRIDLANQYAASAVRFLGCAESVGYFELRLQTNREALLKHPDLQAARHRDDFHQLLRRLSLSVAATEPKKGA